MAQLQLFGRDLPEGFVYRLEFISAEEERTLVGRVEQLSLAQIKMHGVVAKRRAAHFGRSYEHESGHIEHGAEIPDFITSAVLCAAISPMSWAKCASERPNLSNL